ncbi:non-autophagic [Pristimantis euphronides]
MKRSNIALGKAIESGDTDLGDIVMSWTTVQYLKGFFLTTLLMLPPIINIRSVGICHLGPILICCLISPPLNPLQLSNVLLEDRRPKLHAILQVICTAEEQCSRHVTEDQIRLLRIQRSLQEKLDKPYLDYSLHDSVYSLILDGMQKKAEQLYKEFRIPDKRKYVSVFEQPFVEICIKHQNKFEAKKYIARVSPEQRVKAFLLIGDLDQAAEAAIEHKNENEMNMVLSKCSSVIDSATAERIEKAKAQLLKK